MEEFGLIRWGSRGSSFVSFYYSVTLLLSHKTSFFFSNHLDESNGLLLLAIFMFLCFYKFHYVQDVRAVKGMGQGLSDQIKMLYCVKSG